MPWVVVICWFLGLVKEGYIAASGPMIAEKPTVFETGGPTRGVGGLPVEPVYTVHICGSHNFLTISCAHAWSDTRFTGICAILPVVTETGVASVDRPPEGGTCEPLNAPPHLNFAGPQFSKTQGISWSRLVFGFV